VSERDGFEAWWQTRMKYKPARNLEPGYYDEYENPSANMAWKGWQAALAAARPDREGINAAIAAINTDYPSKFTQWEDGWRTYYSGFDLTDFAMRLIAHMRGCEQIAND
jgi:hypothetical protein